MALAVFRVYVLPRDDKVRTFIFIHMSFLDTYCYIRIFKYISRYEVMYNKEKIVTGSGTSRYIINFTGIRRKRRCLLRQYWQAISSNNKYPSREISKDRTDKMTWQFYFSSSSSPSPFSLTFPVSRLFIIFISFNAGRVTMFRAFQIFVNKISLNSLLKVSS